MNNHQTRERRDTSPNPITAKRKEGLKPTTDLVRQRFLKSSSFANLTTKKLKWFKVKSIKGLERVLMPSVLLYY